MVSIKYGVNFHLIFVNLLSQIDFADSEKISIHRYEKNIFDSLKDSLDIRKNNFSSNIFFIILFFIVISLLLILIWGFKKRKRC
ncbi:TPA: hypothetical protein DCG82_02300 [candidate division WOR-3]|jgi:hypothetical protein|uniref:Uncharacterized protein n=2 Tax=Bacteria candidate phyla TaxID=1783234 RepID=A0A117M7A2_UNCT6|nr:MAG: hypothetical protein XE03_0292 [candidate division TA06 bacterium 34_109]HAF07219.1 hypothetical protein [candidate division WOR-3 bacterium]HCP17143.1 hypothetical protein [candidate division WOR-3 bacterium]